MNIHLDYQPILVFRNKHNVNIRAYGTVHLREQFWATKSNY